MIKEEVFMKELSYIKDDHYRSSAISLIKILPDYFFKVAASSTGKYHPTFALGDSGLVRHTKVAVRIANEILSNPCLTSFTPREKDLILIALLVHDGCKLGLPESKYTVFDHPLVISDLIRKYQNLIELNDLDTDFVCKCVETHMGPWTKDYNGIEILTPPITRHQKFVHLCDYLASKKFLDIKFKDNDISE